MNKSENTTEQCIICRWVLSDKFVPVPVVRISSTVQLLKMLWIALVANEPKNGYEYLVGSGADHIMDGPIYVCLEYAFGTENVFVRFLVNFACDCFCLVVCLMF